MASTYTETPENICVLQDEIITVLSEIKTTFFTAKKVLFYDACSFQRHANLRNVEQQILICYYAERGIAVFITRCILMELASDRHRLAEAYIEFIEAMHGAGVKVVLYDEECTYAILAECFSSHEVINDYLSWSVRMLKSPVSTIEEVFRMNPSLKSEVVGGRNSRSSDLYQRFFRAVREKKEHHDNLGEELISICVHILSYLPGVEDGKLCILTDDKGAACKIDAITRRTNVHNRGAKIMLFSTPKLLQYMYEEQVGMTEEAMVSIISQGISGNVTVMGITAFDLEVNEKISMTSRDLVQMIRNPNGIKIVF